LQSTVQFHKSYFEMAINGTTPTLSSSATTSQRHSKLWILFIISLWQVSNNRSASV